MWTNFLSTTRRSQIQSNLITELMISTLVFNPRPLSSICCIHWSLRICVGTTINAWACGFLVINASIRFKAVLVLPSRIRCSIQGMHDHRILIIALNKVFVFRLLSLITLNFCTIHTIKIHTICTWWYKTIIYRIIIIITILWF